MKTITIRLPEPLVSEIEAESHTRGLSKSDVIRERLRAARPLTSDPADARHSIADLIGSVDGLPRTLSTHRKRSLKDTGYGTKRPR